MNLNKNKINKNVAIIVIFLVVVFGIFIFRFTSNEKTSTTTEEYSPSKITYNFTGIVKEKAENYILAEDRTPQPSPFVSEKTGFKRPLIKIKITPETKIGKDNKLIKLEDVKIEDYILAKFLEFSKDTNEATASDVFVFSGEEK
jgi:hypothetical protein